MDIFLCLGKAVKEETTILNLKTEFTIKDPKRKQRKKPTKKRVENIEITTKDDIKTGEFINDKWFVVVELTVGGCF